MFFCIFECKQQQKIKFNGSQINQTNDVTLKLRLYEQIRQQNQKLRYFYYFNSQQYQMSSASPTKSMTNRLLFSKNIRLNFNSKFLPEDFFPESISQYCKSRKKNQKENQYGLSRKQSLDSQKNQDQSQFDKQAINFELLKKRLVKIKQSGPLSNESQSRRKISLKKGESSRQELRKSFEKNKNNSDMQSEVKNGSKGYSKKLMDYMRKMKDVINIDIKFEENVISPVSLKVCREFVKQNPEDVETDNSPKIQRFRPKSEINSRQRLINKQKAKIQSTKPLIKPLKIKVRETNKMMRQSQEKGSNNGSERYNKFVDIQLNQEGMLTFYGSPEQKERSSYDSRKYKVRSSLPKLQK